jgi:hypothetical protein
VVAADSYLRKVRLAHVSTSRPLDQLGAAMSCSADVSKHPGLEIN